MTNSTHVKGCCPLDCPDTCAWVAHVEEGRVVRVEGARDHPITRGVLCAKVRDYQERTYAPDRLLHPLMRCGSKGSGDFRPVRWDEAMGRIAEKFGAIIESDGPEALLPFNYLGSMGVVQRQSLMRLFHALGASRIGGGICGISGESLGDEGHPAGFDPEEMVDSDLIVLWGANVLSTCHHQWHFIEEARRRRGSRIIAIDPRLTRTGRRCDQHISIRPGTDAGLAAGLARIMIEEKWIDLEQASRSIADLKEYRVQIEPWTLERTATECGIAKAIVLDLAREIAHARPALIRLGVGPQQTSSGDGLVRGVSALSILGGHWRHPGGGLFLYAVPEMDEAAAGRPDLQPNEPRSLDMAELGGWLTDPDLDPAVKGLMVWTANPAVTLPDTNRVRRGLSREDLFTVVLEHFMTDTARYADIVLPSTTQLEHFDVQGAWGHHYISVNHPAVSPLGESRSHGEVMRGLAQKMGLSDPALQESDEQIAAASLPSELTLADLKAKGWWKSSPETPALAHRGVKWRLAGPQIEVPPQLDTEVLQLLTPKAHYFLNSTFANMPRQRKAQGFPALEMHPTDAAKRKFSDGQRIGITNDRAKVDALLHITDAVRPGVVSLEGKWWDRPTETSAVANTLSDSRLTPAGQPAYNDTFVRVIPTTP